MIKRLKKPILFFLLLFSAGCTNNHKDQIKVIETLSEPMRDYSLVDYKAEQYGFYIGQSLDSMEKITDFRHNYLEDDGVINDTGITHYMDISEDLVVISGADWLPAMYITTDKKRLTEFHCTIVFWPNSFEKDSIINYLREIEHLFTALKSAENKNKLAETFNLKIENENYDEEFHLDTTERKYDALFAYIKKIKETE